MPLHTALGSLSFCEREREPGSRALIYKPLGRGDGNHDEFNDDAIWLHIKKSSIFMTRFRHRGLAYWSITDYKWKPFVIPGSKMRSFRLGSVEFQTAHILFMCAIVRCDTNWKWVYFWTWESWFGGELKYLKFTVIWLTSNAEMEIIIFYLNFKKYWIIRISFFTF